MPTINLTISLNNIPQDIPPREIEARVKEIVKGLTNMPVNSSIYDNDDINTSNPIYTYNTFKEVERKWGL